VEKLPPSIVRYIYTSIVPFLLLCTRIYCLFNDADILGYTTFGVKMISKEEVQRTTICLLSFQSIGRVNWCWTTPAQSMLVSGPVGNHDHISVHAKTYAFGNVVSDEGRGLTTAGYSSSTGSDSKGRPLINRHSVPTVVRSVG
jgi:hypothetical protein